MANEYTVKFSPDGGATWTTVKSDVEGYFPVGMQDMTGRLWVFYYRSDKIYYDYSNDQGTTWNGETQVSLGAVTPAEGQIGLDIDPTGKIWITFWDDADNEKFAWSADQAATWTVGSI